MARAFTLVEMLVVLAILAASATLALPSARAFVAQAELRSASVDLLAAVRATRSLAVAHNRVVYLLPAGADLSAGWLLATDPGGAGVLARHGPLPAGVTVASRMSNGAGGVYIAYNGAGRPCSMASPLAARWGTLSLHHNGHERRIIINMLGRPRLCDPGRADSHCGS
ncbi:GspH/FimT family pseudopilin [Massilia sp. TS11]|uniref:GspH/FimT family pseudopilin n=1 Tax=Massilia sp. TS11 TaxID=2908003 RepID=UPI001EDBD0B7|nr:GspH/FimT family pseudopilin [Massilia sp. TS11]MCG2586138.1 GspH/FimT family pseudopilin [Massilia sp. TS11]